MQVYDNLPVSEHKAIQDTLKLTLNVSAKIYTHDKQTFFFFFKTFFTVVRM